MIGPVDAFTLARTKLRSKRILLTITVIISGLLFGILSAAIIVASGVAQSTQQFFTTALNGRYLVSADPNIPPQIFGYEDFYKEPSKELKAELNALQDAYFVKQKAIADRYKLPFDKSTVEPILKANPFGEKDGAGNAILNINRESPVYQEYLNQRKLDYTKTAKNKLTDLEKLGTKYGATRYYHNQAVGLQSLTTYLKDGQEKLGDTTNRNSPSSYEEYLTSNVKSSTYTFTDQSIVERFVYPENDLRKKEKDAIPVILTTQEIEKMFSKELKIHKRPSSIADQVAWVQDLQKKSNGYVYSVCYRSTGETALIQKTMQMNTEIAEKKNDKNYTPPSLQYNLPTTPCGELTVKKDTRSAQEKKLLASEEELQKELGTYQPLVHQLLKFQIVGSFTMSDVLSQPQNATAYVSFLLGPQFQQTAFIPQQLYNTLPAASQHKDLLLQTSSVSRMGEDMSVFEKAGIKSSIISFPNLDAARAFIKNEGCDVMSGAECKKPFILATYGSSYLAIDDLSNFITNFAPIVLGIAIAIAMIIIWITMARVIIDSRRETAVFRALGAKRRDIASIYLLYSLLVALLIVIFMLILGFIIALIVESLFSSDATNLAKIAYGVFDELEPFHFIAINLPLLAALAGCIFAISLIAVIPPLWRNVRRSPIRDMRDE